MNVPIIHIIDSDGYDKYRRLTKQFNNGVYESSQSPMSGLNRFRFINKKVDKSDSHWRTSNMIEIYEITIHNDSSIIYLTDYENDTMLLVDDNGGQILCNKTALKENLPFVYPQNAILEIYRPFLIEKRPLPNGCCITDLYNDWGNTLSDIFLYDKENAAYIVNNVEDIIKALSTAHPAYKKLRSDIKEKMDRFAWQISYGYVPIKEDESSVITDKSAWL